ncbi:MAG: hypothetical protein MSJ26_03260 [Oscillospiraceae bacterium]|nr:hypothetical protein [Oscillospiraceae bacterium]
MSFKEHLRSVLSSYFIIATLINAATFVLGELFRPEERFGYDAFLSPLIYAAIALIPMLCMYSKKELTMKQFVFRELLQLVSIEVILIGFGLGAQCLNPENLPLTASFALSILVIFVLVHLFSWLLDIKLAKQLNSDLKIFQSRFSGG